MHLLTLYFQNLDRPAITGECWLTRNSLWCGGDMDGVDDGRGNNRKMKPVEIVIRTFLIIFNLPWSFPLAEIYFASQVLMAVFLTQLFEREFFKKHFTRQSARSIMVGSG